MCMECFSLGESGMTEEQKNAGMPGMPECQPRLIVILKCVPFIVISVK